MSGLSRRFLNVIVENRSAGVQTLRCIDLARHKLFNTTPPSSTGPKKKKKTQQQEKMLPLATPRPSSSFSMRASSGQGSMHCCPAPADRRVLCLHKSSGHSLLMEADTSSCSCIVMMPPLRPKLDPISLYIPDDDGPADDCAAEPAAPQLDDDDDLAADADGGGGTFFIMDRRRIIASKDKPSFEALVYRNPSYLFSPSKCWHCDPLPPPPLPYVHRDFDGDGDGNTSSGLEISSYAVVKNDRSSGGGSSHTMICISVDGVGTYRFDTASHEWSGVAKWTLPFQGKVEYVPELKLWFGFSANDGHFAAADLSSTAMVDMEEYSSKQPQLVGTWTELEPPLQQQEGWQQTQDPQLVHLGSGRFCIARFFSHTDTGIGIPNSNTTSTLSGNNESEPILRCYQNNATVLTGVEVLAHGFNEKVVNRLGIVKHKTRCHNSSRGDDTVVAVF